MDGKKEENNRRLLEKTTASEISANDSIIKPSCKKGKLIDLVCLKADLDTFVISAKNTRLPFELNTDTINEHSSFKELWAFEKGIFELIHPDSTELLVRNHFLITETKQVLRLYLLELKHSSIDESRKFFEKLVARKDYKAYLTDEFYLDYGLTGTTDYVLRIEETILWLNVSCQYSRKEFNQLIEIFKKNIKLTDRMEVIKCFCQEACE